MIRPALPTDAVAIAAIHIRAWQIGYEGLFPPEYLSGLSVKQRAEFWHRELTRNRSLVLVAEEGGVVVGWISGGASRDADARGESEVYAVHVAPDRWRQGIGRQLITAIEARLSPPGDLTLWVLDRNRRAIRFYRTLGYDVDGGEKPGELAGVAFSEIRLRKKRPTLA